MAQHMQNSRQSHSKGQTLAEFALTLPILLLLLFGIIEFGRLFQSWVTLQNSARTAVRYASTGQYKEDRYNIEDIIVCEQNGQSAAERPVGDLGFASYARGKGFPNITVELFEPPLAGVNPETLYASWYGNPAGCAPGPDSDQNRKDMLRLPSIYEEARRGAAGLLIENSRVSPNYESVRDYLYSQFQRPHPDVDRLDWFDVVICSSRDKLWGDTVSQIYDLETDLPTLNPADTSRFQLILDNEEYEPAACILREGPVFGETAQIPDNHGVPWMDAGSPGDRVTVVITYNHRLITPIGLADKVVLQAQRSAINEAFRVSNAPTGPIPPPLPTSTEAIDTPIPSETPGGPTATYTASATDLPPTETDVPASQTPSPFDCENIDAFFRDVPFNGSRLFIEFANFNSQPTYLLESEVHWDKTAAQADFPNMVMSGMALDNEVYWFGEDDTTPTYSNSEGTLFYDPDSRDHFIFIPPGGEKINWQGQYLNAPQRMYEYFTIFDFAGTRFTFDNPESDTDCDVRVYVPPVPTATLEPPGYESPTPTFTPDCASLTIQVQFVSLDIAGDVSLRIINDGPLNAPFTGFNIVWPPMSGVGLDRVVFGGRNALDTPENGGSGIIMWDSPFGGGDTTNNTNSATEQTFVTEVTVPAFSNTLVHLDFVGVSGKLPISPSDLNGSRFDIWCGTTGTGFGGGGGGGAGGSIFLSEINTPVPTNQPPPTWTALAATYTPSNTPPPGIPTETNTPRPTVPSQTPSNTPPATNTPEPTNTKPFGGGAGD